MKKYILSALILSYTSTFVQAQINPVDNWKTSLEIETEARGGSVTAPPSADGHGYLSVKAVHHFLFTRTTELGVGCHYEANNKDNHYIRFGLKASHLFKLRNGGSVATTTQAYAEMSQHGIKHGDGYLAGMYMLKPKKQMQQGVGVIVMFSNPSDIPCVPVYMLYKSLNTGWSLNFMTYAASCNYDFNKKLRFSAGYAMNSKRNWVKQPADGSVILISKALFTPQAAFQWKPLTNFVLTASAGYHIAVSHKLYNERGTDEIADLKKNNAPFICCPNDSRF